jgi:hypothetical protein
LWYQRMVSSDFVLREGFSRVLVNLTNSDVKGGESQRLRPDQIPNKLEGQS